MQLDMKKYKLILEAAPNLIWVSGKDGRCYFFNQTWLEFRGRTLQEEQGKGWIEGVHPEDRERCVDIYMEHFQDRKPFRMTYRLLRKDGEYRWIDDTGVPFYDDEGEFLGFVGSCVDVTDKIKGAQYRKRAVTDGLTDIMNRQHFFEKMEAEYNQVIGRDKRLSLIMFDVDDFKSINDTYGHLIGDKVLKEIANTVGDEVRDLDLFARYGGDEFIIGLPDTGIEEATRVARRIKKAISDIHISGEEGDVVIKCSLGIVELKEGEEKEDFFKRADSALYRAKDRGGNCIISVK